MYSFAPWKHRFPKQPTQPPVLCGTLPACPIKEGMTEEAGEEGEDKEKKCEPEATYGQRYPCPAHQHCNGSFEVRRAADPKGMISCRIQRESVRISAHLSVCLNIQSPTMGLNQEGGQMYIWTDRQTRQTDGRTYTQIPLAFYRTSSPLVPLPKKGGRERKVKGEKARYQ